MNDFIAVTIVNFFSTYINRIIVSLFILNIFIFIVILVKAFSIKKMMDETRGPETDRLEPDMPGKTYLEKLRANYNEWGRRYRHITPWVHYYSVLTTIFPLLGILGTVCGLLQVKSDFTEVQGAFLLALSSTFYGLVAAIISKAGEGIFSPDIDRFRVVYEMFTKDIISIEKIENKQNGDQTQPDIEDAFQH